MLPLNSLRNSPGRAKEEINSTLSTQICPIGCICCIMQQFYNRKCWCKEVKESAGTQTDPVLDEHNTSNGKTAIARGKVYVSVGTQTNSRPEVIVDESVEETETPASHAHVRKQTTPIFISSAPDPAHHQQYLKRRRFTSPTNPVFHLNTPPCSTRRMPSPTCIVLSPVSEDDQSCQLDHQHLPSSHATMTSECTTDISSSPDDLPADDSDDQKMLTGLVASNESYFRQGTFANAVLQREIARITELYDLAGAKDPRFEAAVTDVFQNLKCLQHSPATRKLVRNKIRQKISSRRHYDRMKTAAEKIGVNVSALKKKRTVENAHHSNILGNVLLANSLTVASPRSLWVNTAAVETAERMNVGISDDVQLRSNDQVTSVPQKSNVLIIKSEIPGD